MRHVAANGLRRYVAHSASWFLLGLAVLAVSASTFSGVIQLRHRTTVYAELARQREADATANRRLTGWEREPALRVLKRPEALSAVVAGADALAPMFWDVGPAGLRRGNPPGPLAAAQATTDFDVAVRVVLGLLAIILAIESLAAERASGTLVALLGQAVAPTAVLAGKLAGAAAALAVATASVLAATLATLLIAGPDLVDGGDAATAVLLAAPAWLYAVTCFILALVVTTLIRSYFVAVTGVLILWVVIGLSGAAVASLAARTLSPAAPPYLTESVAERTAAEAGRQAQIELGNDFAIGQPANADWREAEAALAGGAPAARLLRDRARALSLNLRGRLDGIVEKADAPAHRQRRIAVWLSVISPGALLTEATSAIAGTGVASTWRWEEAARGYQRTLNALLFDDRPRLVLYVPASVEQADETSGRSIIAFNVRPPITIDSLPRFEPPDARLAARAAEILWPIGLLAVHALALAGIAAVTFHGILARST